VCLTATPEAILERIGAGEGRPLLAGCASDVERLERIRAMLVARAAAYGTASHTIDTTGLTVDQVVDRVRAAVEAR
jgi:shikimate kinase